MPPVAINNALCVGLPSPDGLRAYVPHVWEEAEIVGEVLIGDHSTVQVCHYCGARRR